MNFPKLKLQSMKSLLADLDNHAFIFALLGIICGLLSALLIVAFRLLIENSQNLFISGPATSFESLPLHIQLLLPSAGFLLMAIVIHFFGGAIPSMGLIHVKERMRNHQGYFPVRNIINQFINGAIALGSGQSAGREGAAVHLGAGISSLFGTRLRLNNHDMKTLVACGSAAAISASFNTPLAGVIFALEVILLEYSIYSFIPIILASVSGSIISQAVFGDDLIFMVPSSDFHSLWELPFLIFMALVIGSAAAAAIKIAEQSAIYSKALNIWWRFGLAAIVTAAGLFIAPQIMGQGYDTVSQAMSGELPWKILLVIALSKIVVTAIVVGLGVPSGFIGPSLVMGACLGGVIGIAGASFSPIGQSDISFYVMIGMAAMMGALLKAPLAALIAALEFTGNINVLMPAMLVIVISNLICSDFFKQNSLIEVLLDHTANPLRGNTLRDWLKNTHVHHLAETRFSQQNRYITPDRARNLCKQNINYILVSDEHRPTALITVSMLEFYLRFSEYEEQEIDLLEIPGDKKDLAELSSNSYLEQAIQVFESKNVHAVYLVNDQNPSGNIFISGVLLKEQVDQYFRS